MKVVVDEGAPKQLVKALRELGIDADRFNKSWEETINGKLIAAVEAAGFRCCSPPTRTSPTSRA